MFAERLIGFVVLLVVTSLIYVQARRDSNCPWWGHLFAWAGAFFLTLLVIEVASLPLSLLGIMLSCLLSTSWPSHEQQLLVMALIIGAFSILVVESTGENACLSWSESGKRPIAAAELGFASCIALGSLLQLSCAWLSLETMYFGQETQPGLASKMFLLGLPLALLWLLPLLAPYCGMAGKKLAARLSLSGIKQHRRKLASKRRQAHVNHPATLADPG